ncbi:hypothetical protein V8D89_009989 [Ganoderma adspersum]
MPPKPPKPSNWRATRPAAMTSLTSSPDPLGLDATDSYGEADSDPSPPPRALTGRRIVRQPPPPSQPDDEWSPQTSRLVGAGRNLARSPENEEEDSPGALPVHQTSNADVDVRGKLDFGAVSSDSDTETTTSAARPHPASIPGIPRAPSPDASNLFWELDEDVPSEPPQSSSRPASSPEPSQPELMSSPESAEDEDVPLIPPLPVPPPPRVWLSDDGVGAVFVPIRDDLAFPPELQDAESTMASQIASAMNDPRDEGLGSATFQTLLDTFLLPRLKGHNSEGHRVKVHQYSQFAARRGQEQGVVEKNVVQNSDALARMYKLDKDDAAMLDAVARRRVPDMTCMATFEERILAPDGLSYRLESHRGPKLCITEIKSFAWSGGHDDLHQALATAVVKGHRQNYVAAQFVFLEDERLDQVASFVGVGPVWLYSEWSRSQYPDLYGMPSPRNKAELLRYQEREAEETPDGKKTARPLVRPRKRLRVDSPESEDALEQPDMPVDDPQPVTPPPTRKGPNTRAVIRESDQSDVSYYLPEVGSKPWSVPAHIQEIFVRRRAGEKVMGKPSDHPFLYVLDPDGRTYEAFDAIVERIRGWFTSEKCPAEYRIIFEEDPYAGGSCPATMAKMRGEVHA